MKVRTVTEPDRGDGRREIATAAVAILVEGDEPITMRSIGARLGVQASTLYQYVRDKDELLALVVDQVLGQVPTGSGSLAERATALTDHLVGIVTGTPEVVRVFRAAPDTTHRAIAEILAPEPHDDARRHELGVALTAAVTGLLVWGTGRPGTGDEPVVVCALLRAAVGALLEGYGRPATTRQAPADRAPATSPDPVATSRAARRVSGSVVPARRIRFDPVPGAR